jgi:hypothetical protein
MIEKTWKVEKFPDPSSQQLMAYIFASINPVTPNDL